MDKRNVAAITRLLGRLAGEDVLVCRDRAGAVRIVRPDKAGAQPATRLDIRVFTDLLQQELLQPVAWQEAGAGEVYFKISPLGIARLRRHLAKDHGVDAFRQQHLSVTAARSETAQKQLRNQSESPLEWLYKRRGKNGKSFISKDQFDAGERLRRDFTFAQLEPRVTSSWNPLARIGPSAFTDGAEISDRVIVAKQRFYQALDRVGPGLGDILLEVCCHLTGLAEAERKLDWPARSGKIVLAIALDQLARHYGMVATGPAYGRIQGGASSAEENRNKILD